MKAPSTSSIRGPFVVQQQGPDEPIYILDMGNRFVAGMMRNDIPKDSLMEHAQLLAAAPEMFAALKALFEHCAMIHRKWGDGCNSREASAAIAAGRAAIAKVEGGGK